MQGNALAMVQDLDIPSALLYLYLQSRQFPRDAVARAVKAHKTVPRHEPGFAQEPVKHGRSGKRPQVRSFQGSPVTWPFTSSAMDPSALALTPGQRLVIEVGQVCEAPSWPEVALHEFDSALNLPLGLWPPGLAQTWDKPDCQGEVGKQRIPSGFTRFVPPQHDDLWVVEEHVLGGTAEVQQRIRHAA